MLRSFLHCLCLVTLLSCNLVKSTITEDEEPRRTFPARRAIDGSRGNKYYVAENIDDGAFDSFGSSAGQYDPFEVETDFSDIRSNIPGEPGVDYPSYTRLPQTGFVCEDQFRGYYADEAAGCQVFHVCDGNFLVSSFLCPVGSIFSQRLLTCDWWIKVDCSTTRNYHAINSQSLVSEADDDDILRKAFEMASVRSSGERIPVSTVSERRLQNDRKSEVFDYGIGVSTQRSINDLQTGPENYPDYPDYPSRSVSTRYRTSGQQLPNRQRYQDNDYYSPDAEEDGPSLTGSPKISVHTIGDDRKNDRRIPSRNEFPASYAPTVPTVTTTSRRFYSPTIPTTPRSSSRSRDSSGYDLEVESSDHLYTARGRSDETVKAATPPTVVLKNASRPEFSLPMLVNSAMEEKGGEGFGQSVNSGREPSTFRNLSTNPTTVETSTEETIRKDGGAHENTEDLAIFTIDEENRDPGIFSYSRGEEETNSNVESSSTPETRLDFSETSGLASATAEVKLAQTLEPPQKSENHFRIMVLDKSASTGSRIVEDSDSDEESLKNNSTSAGSVLVDVPASHVTPPWTVSEKDSRESRIIRIFINNNETNGRISSDSFASQNPVRKSEETATVGKISGRSTAVPYYDATPNTISKFDDQRPVRVNNFGIPIANEESTLNFTTTLDPVETSSTLSEFGVQKPVDDNYFGHSIANGQSTHNFTTTLDPVGTTSARPKFGDQRPVDVNSFGHSIANEQSTHNFTTTLDPVGARSTLPKFSDQRPVDDNYFGYSIANEQSSHNFTTTLDPVGASSTRPKFSDQRPVDVNSFGLSTTNGQSTHNFTTTLDPVETSSTLPKFSDQRPVDVNSFGFSTTNGQSTHNFTTTLDPVGASSTLPKFSDQRPVDVNSFGLSTTNGQPTHNFTTTLDLAETSSTRPKFSDQRPVDVHTFGVSVFNAESNFNVTTTPAETSSIPFEDGQAKDNESSLYSEETLEQEETSVDSTNSGSSPFQVTLTVDKSEELDRNGDVIRRLIAQQDKGRSISAGVHKNFEIVRSEERGEPFVQSPRDHVFFRNDPDDPRNDRRVSDQREGRKIGEEKSRDYSTDSFQPTDYRNIIALVNGPNAPRPFSLGTQRNLGNVEIKTPSDLGDGETSTSSPFVTFGTSSPGRNEIFTVTTRNPSQTTRQSIVSSSQDQPERLEKSTSTTELFNTEDNSEQSRRSFGERKIIKQKTSFELPHQERSLDFVTGSSLHPRDDGKKSAKSDGEDIDYSTVSEKSAEKLYARTVVETEVIPSLGFSLNTEEGREEFMEAVMKGLLQYVPETENTKNATETSTES